MKNLNKLALCAMTLGLAACSQQDEPIQGTVDGSVADAGKDVYASITIKLPNEGSKAEGDPVNNGIEVGQDYENKISKIIVVLATKNASGNYTYLTHAVSDTEQQAGQQSGSNVTYSLTFSSEDMTPKPSLTGGDTNLPGTDVYVFAYCNPTKQLSDYIAACQDDAQYAANFTDITGEIAAAEGKFAKDDAFIWDKGHFLMTNSKINDLVTIPSRETLVSQHNDPTNAFNLGTVQVKRVVARFDFKTTNNNIYEITNTKDESIGSVELTEMAVFNIAKNFYYLPRSSSKWDWSNPVLCGDLEANVISFNKGGFKSAGSLKNGVYKNYYFSKLIDNAFRGTSLIPDQQSTNEEDGLKWVSLRNWNDNHDEDDDNGWEAANKEGYRIWRYVTENTIPQSETNVLTSSQKIGITTGVVFRAEFTPTDVETWNGNVVYVHDDIIYGDFAALCEYVKEYPETFVADDFKKVESFKDEKAEGSKTKNLLAGVKDDDAHKFKAYVPCADNGQEVDGQKLPIRYQMYYFYYNRHITNGKNYEMGTNEFGVVRNNVYKLAVTVCKRLGEPDSPNDPDEPDEEEKVYFAVSCEVLPWTVRVNDIEF